MKIKNILNFLIKKTNYKNELIITKQTKSFLINLSKAKQIGYKPRSVKRTIRLFLNQKRLKIA